METGTIITAIIALAVIAFIIYAFTLSLKIVKEREVIIMERFGKFHSVLTAGVHFVVPFMDSPKKYSYSYYTSQLDANGNITVEKREGKNLYRLYTMDSVLDFPKQNVITRDNASLYLDAVLSYKIVNPKQMIYSCQNLQEMLSKLLQAQLRNVAGSLDVDQIIEDASAVNVLTGLMDNEASRWGVKIKFVKIQKIDTPGLEEVLAKKKKADLHNKEVVISAKAHKQTQVIEAEGGRDSMVKEAEGEAQMMLSTATGQAQAIINNAHSEARSVREIARAISKFGDDPAQYLLSIKYIDALKKIMAAPNTKVKFLPVTTTTLQTGVEMGMNTIFHPKQE